jgi:hypothetical protein
MFHRALRMPDQGRLTDAASYLQQLCFSVTKYQLDRLAIRVLLSADDLRLEGESCWRLGLIVSELLTNVARQLGQVGRSAWPMEQFCRWARTSSISKWEYLPK